MNKLNELKNRKLDNKGFSLVELIIVIAIMAVLIGVLAPQYLKYVEKSRVATDNGNITAIKDAIQVYGADPDSDPTKPLANGDNIILNRIGPGTINGNGVAEALKMAGLPSAPADLPKLTNKQKKAAVTITVTINPTTGTVTVTDDFDTP